MFNLPPLSFAGQPRLLRVGQNRVNPYDLLGRFIGSIRVLDLLDGLLCYELHAMAFSHQFFEVLFPGEAIILEVHVSPMEGIVFSGILLVQVFF